MFLLHFSGFKYGSTIIGYNANPSMVTPPLKRATLRQNRFDTMPSTSKGLPLNKRKLIFATELSAQHYRKPMIPVTENQCSSGKRYFPSFAGCKNLNLIYFVYT